MVRSKCTLVQSWSIKALTHLFSLLRYLIPHLFPFNQVLLHPFPFTQVLHHQFPLTRYSHKYSYLPSFSLFIPMCQCSPGSCFPRSSTIYTHLTSTHPPPFIPIYPGTPPYNPIYHLRPHIIPFTIYSPI